MSLDLLVIPRYVEDLFCDSVVSLMEKARMPVNISRINDIMRQRDPSFHVNSLRGVGNFQHLCRWFEKRGIITLSLNHRHTVMIL